VGGLYKFEKEFEKQQKKEIDKLAREELQKASSIVLF
jgi:hypothetical protein